MLKKYKHAVLGTIFFSHFDALTKNVAWLTAKER